MTGRQTGDKPLTQPVIAYFPDLRASYGLNELKHLPRDDFVHNNVVQTLLNGFLALPTSTSVW